MNTDIDFNKYPIVVGTYNMSFASEWDTVPGYASEFGFLQNTKKEDGTYSHEYFKNALKHLKEFITDKKPIAIGLQEMNMFTEYNDISEINKDVGNYKDSDDNYTKGVRYVSREIGELGSKYKMYSGMVKPNNAAVSIIIDTSITGNVLNDDNTQVFEPSEIFQTQNNKRSLGGKNIKIIDHYNEKGGLGRPILMLYTEKDFLFVCMHGAQTPNLATPIYKEKDPVTDKMIEKKGSVRLFNEDIINQNKKFVEAQIGEFLGIRKPKYIFIMGDLNDRFDAIKDYNIGGKTVTYSGQSPLSCCYNWDSAGTEGTSVLMPSGDDKNQNTIFKRGNPKPNGTANLDDDHRSNVGNYLYKGDKVFSSIERKYKDTDGEEFSSFGNLDIFKMHIDIRSTKSDHELVYLEYYPELEQVTGGNKKRRMNKTKKRRGKPQKKRGGKTKKK